MKSTSAVAADKQSGDAPLDPEAERALVRLLVFYKEKGLGRGGTFSLTRLRTFYREKGWDLDPILFEGGSRLNILFENARGEFGILKDVAIGFAEKALPV